MRTEFTVICFFTLYFRYFPGLPRVWPCSSNHSVIVYWRRGQRPVECVKETAKRLEMTELIIQTRFAEAPPPTNAFDVITAKLQNLYEMRMKYAPAGPIEAEDAAGICSFGGRHRRWKK